MNEWDFSRMHGSINSEYLLTGIICIVFNVGFFTLVIILFQQTLVHDALVAG